MSRLPTVKIATKNGPVVINKSDFDENKHTLFTDDKSAPASEPVSEPNPAAPAGEPDPATPAAPAAPENERMLVTKKGRKFIVVNDKGEPVEREGIDKDGYTTEADAWGAVTALVTAAPATNG